MSTNRILNSDPIKSIDNKPLSSYPFLCSKNNKRVNKDYFVVQNIRSVRANFDYFLSELNSICTSPLFIFLTEIFLFDYEVENYKIENYVSHATCNNTYKSGGVIVLFEKTLNVIFSVQIFSLVM